MGRRSLRAWGRRLGAFGVMLVGATAVLLSMVWMNGYTQAPPKAPREAGRTVVVAPPPPPPKRTRPKPQPRPKAAPRRARAATPPPALGGGLAGVALSVGPALGAAPTELGGGLLGDPGRDLVMTEDAVDAPPRPTRRVAPAYPPGARRRGQTGHVTLTLTIGADGRVQSAQVVESEPAGVFDDAARSAVERWSFEPGTYQGQPKTVAGVRQTLRFTLETGT